MVPDVVRHWLPLWRVENPTKLRHSSSPRQNQIHNYYTSDLDDNYNEKQNTPTPPQTHTYTLTHTQKAGRKAYKRNSIIK